MESPAIDCGAVAGTYLATRACSLASVGANQAPIVGLATYVGTLALSTPACWAQPLKRSLLDDFNSGESS